jgi:hypothetical protein
MFGQVCKATERRDMGKLAKSILFPPHLSGEVVTHGKVHKASAAAEFEKFTSKKLAPCGLFVSCEHPFLAASPDRMIDKEEKALVEMKCPFVGRKQKIAPVKNFLFLENAWGPDPTETQPQLLLLNYGPACHCTERLLLLCHVHILRHSDRKDHV